MTDSPTTETIPEPKSSKPEKPKVAVSRTYVRHFKRLLTSFLEEHAEELGQSDSILDLIGILDREIVEAAIQT